MRRGLVAQTVDRDADDDAARHVALEGFARGHVTRCGASEAHRDAQALRGAHGDVGAPLARCLEQASDSRSQTAVTRGAPVCRGGEVGVVAHRAVGGRVLDDGAELLAREFVFVVFVDDLDAERGSLRVSSTSSVCGKRLRSTKSWLRPSLTASRELSANIMSMASAAAVPSSSSEQLPISMPVREISAVWKLSSASSRPCEISAW